ncbi:MULTISPECIES: prolyl-tRNA synthetase associated domain-containing protein [Anaerotruncus]|jgi:Ala-tRNA(Pro) deacylase|uniref:prolyl-tRNA synthetase associated domain-containing protein n=1 Tax=Anaerotruncus TaxID=244127 RepID=UPI000836D020|nr:MULTISPECIES: prolyl-tRNA synthetase associated domain-containing protein [Anaerotruncus]RGX56929.1 prolyl-tRNA synthetase associated domain-containing protein [Anaerotruncus sp. AF02-27]
MTQREKALARLDEAGAPYELIEHPAVFTIEEMDKLGITLSGEVCKNLFLRDAKGRRHFLVVVQKDKHADLRALEKELESTRLSFASAERLEKYLGLHQGEVTPLGVVNDADAAVEVAFDKDLVGNPKLGVHPNDNTATVWIAFDDLRKVIEANGNAIRFVTV